MESFNMDNKDSNDLDYIIEIEDKVKTKTDVKLEKTFEWLICIILSVGFALFIRYYMFAPRIVNQYSMSPTLESEHRVVVRRLNAAQKQNIARGSIVTIEAPDVLYITENIDLKYPVAVYEEKNFSIFDNFYYYVLEADKINYMKRVIAVGGDHIKISNNKVYVNNALLDEPYLPPDTQTTSMNGAFTDIVVPEGHVFVMGDNRTRSTDSRSFGCIPVNKIDGVVFIRFSPLSLFGKVK